jgi:amino acid transporter
MDPKLGNGGEGRDPEKALHSSKSNSSAENAQATYMDEAPKGPWTTRFVDSFRRDPNAAVTKPSERAVSGEHGGFDHTAAAEATANSGLSRKLKARHLQMIAIGGSIGMYCFAFLKHSRPTLP